MNLYQKITDACKKKGVTVNTMEKDLGFARSSINKMKQSSPSGDKLAQIAEYLDVSMDYLMGREELSEADKRDIAKSLDQMMNQIESKEDEPLMYNGQPLSDASIQLLRNAFEFALTETKKENKVKYNPNKNK